MQKRGGGGGGAGVLELNVFLCCVARQTGHGDRGRWDYVVGIRDSQLSISVIHEHIRMPTLCVLSHKQYISIVSCICPSLIVLQCNLIAIIAFSSSGHCCAPAQQLLIFYVLFAFPYPSIFILCLLAAFVWIMWPLLFGSICAVAREMAGKNSHWLWLQGLMASVWSLSWIR